MQQKPSSRYLNPNLVQLFNNLPCRANHPNAVVYNESSNCLLQHAIDAAEGRNPTPLRGKGNNEELPPMPQKGDVEFIYGGISMVALSNGMF